MKPKNNQACVFQTIRQHAQGIVDGTLKTGDLKGLFDELRGYRNYFEEWVGEQSPEYQLTNAMLVLSRVLKSMSDDSNIKHWIAKYPIYSEWYSRIESILEEDSVREHSFNTGTLRAGNPFMV